MTHVHRIQPEEAKAAVRLLRHKVHDLYPGQTPDWFSKLEAAINAGQLREALRICDQQKSMFSELGLEEAGLLTGLWNALSRLIHGDYDPRVGPPCLCVTNSPGFSTCVCQKAVPA